MAAGDKLRVLESRFHKYVKKTNEMEAVCTVLEKEVRRLRKRATKAGKLKEGQVLVEANGNKKAPMDTSAQ